MNISIPPNYIFVSFLIPPPGPPHSLYPHPGNHWSISCHYRLDCIFLNFIYIECILFHLASFIKHYHLETYSHHCNINSSMLLVVHLPSCVWLFATPRTAAHQASLSLTISCSLPKFLSIESVMPSNHLILCHPLLLLPSIFSSFEVFCNESAVHISEQSIGASASASVLPKSIQSWFPLRLTDLISLFSKELSRVFSSTPVQKHQLFGSLPSFLLPFYCLVLFHCMCLPLCTIHLLTDT